MITKRIQQLQASPTLTLDAKVKRLEAEGINIINLGLGEPDFATPEHIKNAAKKALDMGQTHYTQAAGVLELRKAISQKLK